MTDDKYWHITVDADNVDCDLLIAQNEFQEEPVVGGVIHGTFFLSAMIYNHSKDIDWLQSNSTDEHNAEKTDENDEEENSVSTMVCVVRPIGDHVAQHIRECLKLMYQQYDDFFVVDFDGEDRDNIFILVYAEILYGEFRFNIEYSRLEEGKQIIYIRRHLTLEEASEIIVDACRKPTEEYDFTGWLDSCRRTTNAGLESNDTPQPSMPNARIVHHVYPIGTNAMNQKIVLSFGDFVDSLVTDDPLRAAVRIVAEDNKNHSFTDEELDVLAEIMYHTIVCYQVWTPGLSGVQIGISNDPYGQLTWKKDKDHADRYHIQLCVDDMDDWCGVMKQIGYALAHCVMHRYSRRRAVPWLEEIICQMMPLMLITYFEQNWNCLNISDDDPGYDLLLRDYLTYYITEYEWTKALDRCTSLQELCRINQSPDMINAESHYTIIQLYYMTTAAYIKGLFSYSDYKIGDTCLVDIESWQMDYPENIAVRYLASIQQNAVNMEQYTLMKKIHHVQERGGFGSFKCDCCGEFTGGRYGYDIACTTCGWSNDWYNILHPNAHSGPNGSLSLNEAKQIWEEKASHKQKGDKQDDCSDS